MMPRYHAILLLGPTGSGKSPLGDCLQRAGLWGRRCLHLDFGENLRRIAAAGGEAAGLNEADVQFIDRALRTGALLENETFYIAERVLQAFVQEHDLRAGDLLVLNGLPRHLDQARDMDRIVRIGAVLHLACSADVVYERIRLDSGGDRAGREDDAREDIARKLRTFRDRTRPLLRHYRRQGATVLEYRVSAATRPDEVAAALEGGLQVH